MILFTETSDTTCFLLGVALEAHSRRSELQRVGRLLMNPAKMADFYFPPGSRANTTRVPLIRVIKQAQIPLQVQVDRPNTREKFPGEFVRPTGAPITTISINVTRNTAD